MHPLLPASFALALVAPSFAMADTTTDIQTLRQEIESIRAAYEARLQALEQRLKAAEANAAAPNAAAAPPPLVATAAPSVAPPAADSAGGGLNAFNPAMSLILSGRYAHTSQDPANYAITGFQLPAEAEIGPGDRGLSLSETELDFSANIDPWLRGAANIALAPEGGVEVEEAYIQTTALEDGFSLKAGRFFSGIGYLNSQHGHTWDFVDSPLAYQALLGGQYGDDGVQLTWLAPIDQYLQLGVELGRGGSFPAAHEGNGLGMWALTAHTGGDVGDSHSWRAGLSMQRTRATDLGLVAQDINGATVNNAFTGNSRVWVADAVWKWAPDGNATRTNFKLQAEYLRSTRDGSLLYDLDGTNSDGTYRATQSGWYLQGLYQFMPHWRVGLRTEQLDAGSVDYGANAAFFASSGYTPRKNTLMLDYAPSEFSRVRLQFGQDRSRAGITDNQVFVQYQMSLGAHGAHSF